MTSAVPPLDAAALIAKWREGRITGLMDIVMRAVVDGVDVAGASQRMRKGLADLDEATGIIKIALAESASDVSAKP